MSSPSVPVGNGSLDDDQTGRSMDQLGDLPVAPLPQTTQHPQTNDSQPDGSQPDGIQSDDSRPDGSRPDDSQPDDIQPGHIPPDRYKPDGYKPDGYKPDGYKPDGSKPDGSKPDGSQLGDSQPDRIEIEHAIKRTLNTVLKNQRLIENRLTAMESTTNLHCNLRGSVNNNDILDNRNTPNYFFTGNDWRTDEIGYFWPDLLDDVSIQHSGRQVYFKDVNVFIDRLRDVVDYKGEHMVKANIQTTLRGSALDWFTSELRETEKQSLRTLPLEDGWFDQLIKRFRPRISEALMKVNNLHYGFADLQAGKTPRMFVQEVVRVCKAARMDQTFSQITTAWSAIDASMRRDLDEPTEMTTLAQFIDQVESRTATWQDLAPQYTRKRSYWSIYGGKDLGSKDSKRANGKTIGSC